MAGQQVETVLNQMKRSGYSQTVMPVAATGQQVVPRSEDRVSLILSSHPTSILTYSLSPTPGVGAGITIPAGGAPLVLSLGHVGSIVKGPLYLADATTPLSVAFMESLNNAP